MELNNKILESLSKIPKLVEVVERLLEDNEKKFNILTKVAQNKVQAEVSPEEIDKVSEAVKKSVSSTSCALPDTSKVSTEISEKVAAEIRDVIYADVKAAASTAIKDTPQVTKKEVSLLAPWEAAKFAENKTRQFNRFLVIACAILFLALGVCVYGYFGGKVFLGKQYADIYFSKYTTDAEKEMLLKDVYDVSFVPKEYFKAPARVRQKIRSNKQILRKRKAEASTNKDQYSTSVPLER